MMRSIGERGVAEAAMIPNSRRINGLRRADGDEQSPLPHHLLGGIIRLALAPRGQGGRDDQSLVHEP